MKHGWRVGWLSLQICMMLAGGTVFAAEPQWPEVKVTMQVQQRPLRNFLQDLFGSIGLQVSLSEGVSGTISGRFSDNPRTIFEKLVRSHNLLPYYDGAVMHVASASELVGKSIAVAPDEGRALLVNMQQQGMLDGFHSAQLLADARLIKLRGSTLFVQETEDLLAAQRQKTIAAPLLGATQTKQGGNESAGQTVGQIVRTFPLRYASAGDMVLYQNGQPITVPGMATLLNQMVGDGGPVQADPYASVPRSGNTVERLRDKGGRGYGARTSGNSSASSEGALRPAEVSSGSRTGGIRIVADRTLNAVVVRDRADAMPMYEQLIADLDKSPQLIEIQVTIIDVDRNRLRDIGVDWRFQDGRTSAQAGGGGGITPDLGGLLFNTVIGDARRFFARINALASDGAARITSRPQVLTISNMEALVRDDKSFYVKVAGQQDVDLFNVSAGTSLRVLPFVVGDPANPEIRLTVSIEDGSISNQLVVDGLPTVDRSSLNTQAVVGNGQNLLLGGLVRERDESRTDKVPVLGDVPVIGSLFRRTVENQSRTERLYLITPRVLPAFNAQTPAPVQPANPTGNGGTQRPFQDINPAPGRPLQTAEHRHG